MPDIVIEVASLLLKAVARRMWRPESRVEGLFFIGASEKKKSAWKRRLRPALDRVRSRPVSCCSKRKGSKRQLSAWKKMGETERNA